jgi:hypothetical protein
MVWEFVLTLISAASGTVALLSVLWFGGRWAGRIDARLDAFEAGLNSVHARIDQHMQTEDRTIQALVDAQHELAQAGSKLAESVAYIAGHLGLEGEVRQAG